MDNETIRSNILGHNIYEDGGYTCYVDDDAALETAMDALKQLGYTPIREPFSDPFGIFEALPSAVNAWLDIVGPDWAQERDGGSVHWFILKSSDEDSRTMIFAVVSSYRDRFALLKDPKADVERYRVFRIFGRNEMRG